MSQSVSKNTSTIKKLVFLAIICGILFVAAAFGMYHFSNLHSNSQTSLEKTEQKLSEQRVRFAQLQQFADIDASVIHTGDYEVALKKYQDMLPKAYDSLQMVIEERIKHLEEFLDDKRDNTSQSDPRDMMISKYRDRIDELEANADSLQNVSQSRQKDLRDEISTLKDQLAQKEKALHKEIKVQVITFNSPNGSKIHYLGEVENGKAHGGGVGIWPTGSVYRGDWKNNLRHGQGKYEWADGEIYEGTFVDDRREGQGKYYWPSGERYDGQWVNNRRNGAGKLFDMDGNIRYEGQWKDDKPLDK